MKKKKTKVPIPDSVERDGPALFWGSIHLATVHEDIEITVTPEELKRFASKNKKRLMRLED